MKLGSIEYLNLLPFAYFLKRRSDGLLQKKAMTRKKGVPSAINGAFKKRKIEAGFISSIVSRGCKCSSVGIVANKKVQSVLLVAQEPLEDKASATSNRLALLLNLSGRVIIGDEALKWYAKYGNENSVDLATAWYEKHKLPFVFARFCFNSNELQAKKLAISFAKSKYKLPDSLLQKQADSRKISKQQLKEYLMLIKYELKTKEKRSLKKFLFLTKNKPFKILT